MAASRKDPVANLQEMERAQDERSKRFSEILRDVIGNIQAIIRSEVHLAKTEMKEEASAAAAAGALGAVGGLLAVLGTGFLFSAAAFALALIMPAWLACLLVALALIGVGGGLVFGAWTRFRNVHLVPPRTAETLKENAQWLRTQTR